MILVIEDDKTINELLCGILRNNGYEAVGAQDGLAGLRPALEKEPRLILMDLMLPFKLRKSAGSISA